MAMYYHIRNIIHAKKDCTRLVYVVAIATEKLSEYNRPFGPNGAQVYILYMRSFYGRRHRVPYCAYVYDTIMV